MDMLNPGLMPLEQKGSGVLPELFVF